MTTITFSKRAREDLFDLWQQIAIVNPVAADRIADRIIVRCESLVTHPEIGPARPEVGMGARALIIEKWIAFYRVREAGVQIVRIVDGRRDLTSIVFQD